ncbi:MAG: DVUA0089 family protein [Planctomycetota bacterium]
MKTAIFAVAGAAAVALAQPASFDDLGVIGGEGTYSFDTTGSFNVTGAFDLDTEIGLWDASGTLLDSDDDGLGFPFSIVTADLSAGMYFIGIGEFDSIFGDGFTNTGTSLEDGEQGDAVLNINGSFAASQIFDAVPGGNGETAFFKVTVVPAPGAAALLGLGGLAAVRRRR